MWRQVLQRRDGCVDSSFCPNFYKATPEPSTSPDICTHLSMHAWIAWGPSWRSRGTATISWCRDGDRAGGDKAAPLCDRRGRRSGRAFTRAQRARRWEAEAKPCHLEALPCEFVGHPPRISHEKCQRNAAGDERIA